MALPALPPVPAYLGTSCHVSDPWSRVLVLSQPTAAVLQQELGSHSQRYNQCAESTAPENPNSPRLIPTGCRAEQEQRQEDLARSCGGHRRPLPTTATLAGADSPDQAAQHGDAGQCGMTALADRPPPLGHQATGAQTRHRAMAGGGGRTPIVGRGVSGAPLPRSSGLQWVF